MSNTASVPQSILFHTDFAAFSDALRAVAPSLMFQAADYQASAQARRLTFTDDECLGRAVKLLLAMAEREADDEIEPGYDLDAVPDYNDDELLHCGIDR